MPSVPFEQWNPRFGSPDLYQTINQHQTSLDVTITVTKAYADEGRTIIAYTLSAPGTTKHLLVGAFDLTSPTPQKPEVLFATECDAPQDAGHAVLSGAASLPGSSGSQHTAACVGGQTTDRERYSNDPPRIVAILLHGAIPSRAPAGPTRPRARCSVPVLSGGRSGAGLARISVHRHPVSMQQEDTEPMNASLQFCPTAACSARGQTGQGNITLHGRKRQRYRCHTCGQTFSARRGRMWEGLRKPTE